MHRAFSGMRSGIAPISGPEIRVGRRAGLCCFAASNTTSSPLVPPSLAASNRYRVSLWDALKFNGPAPELVNGRLAMVGWVNAVVHEVTTSQTVLQQAQELDWVTLAVLAMWVYATMVPICKGVRHDEAFGFFTPGLERNHGRAAMLGIVGLAALEAQVGQPFF
ncbi:hypothetical protein V8C86DRAFT_2688082 [Haematococcus lacustris]